MSTVKEIFKHSNKIVQTIKGEKVIIVSLDSEDDSVYEIEGLSVALWLNFDGKRTLQELIQFVMEEKNIPEQYHRQFESDSITFIQELKELNFLI